MKISNSIPALLFLTGMMCLFFSSCNDDESEKETMVPLRLSMTIPAAEGSVTTRAEEMGKFKIALSTSNGYADNTKTYTTSSETPTLVSLTSSDPLTISRLVTSTPLTLYGTYNYSTLGIQPVFYSGEIKVTEGAVSIQPQWGNAIIVVHSGNDETYNVNITALQAPTITGSQYEWKTSEKTPTLIASSNKPATFETTSKITQPSQLAKNYYASVVPATVAGETQIMTITNPATQETYTVKTPASGITFEANKCYFITLEINDKNDVTMTMDIAPMIQETIVVRIPGIYNKQDLIDFQKAWNENGTNSIDNNIYDNWLDKKNNTVTLFDDINLTGEQWTPIGTNTNTFKNITFDGNNHTISNLTNVSTGEGGGIFGLVTNSTVKNLKVENATINMTTQVCPIGIIASNVLDGGKISNCHVSGKLSISGNTSYVGGIAGNIQGSNIYIQGCTVTGLETTTGVAAASGIANLRNSPGNSEAYIEACIVSKCTIKANGSCGGISTTDDNKNKLNVTACTVANTCLYSNFGSATNPIAEDINTITNCYYAKVTDKNDSAIGATDINMYLFKDEELKSDYVNGQLNNALNEKSCPYIFENGQVKSGNPTKTDYPDGIYIASHLMHLSNEINSNQKIPEIYGNETDLYFRRDIDMEGLEFRPLDLSQITVNSECRIYGENHKISNLKNCSSFIKNIWSTKYDETHEINNLIFVKPLFTSESEPCGLISTLSGRLKLTNCQILEGTITSGNVYSGGLIGSINENATITITKCLVSNSTIQSAAAEGCVGGFIGYMGERYIQWKIADSALRNITLGATYPGGFIGKCLSLSITGSSREITACLVQKINWANQTNQTRGYIMYELYSQSFWDLLSPSVVVNDVGDFSTYTEVVKGSIKSENCKRVDEVTSENATTLNNYSTDKPWIWSNNCLTQSGWVPDY